MPPTIGQRLKAEREAQELTLEKVFEVTRIRIPYLQALESDDLSGVPSPVQARGYLRNYADYLGLDFQELLDEMRANMQGTSGEVVGPADEAASSPLPSSAEEGTSPSTQPATQGLDPEYPDLSNRPEILEEKTSLPEPKPGRRKKSDSKPKSASMESGPKRRKKPQPEPEVNSVVEPVAPETVPPEPAIVEAPGTPVDSIQPEVAEEQAVSQRTNSQSEVSDTFWQSWLNRLGSVVSARIKRRTLVQREPISPESNSDATPASQGAFLAMETHQAPAVHNYPPRQSSEIFKEIGLQLRERRELLSLHLDEVERNTHVKAHYLEALENGAMDQLPSTVQTRGMLSNYATFLDMDVDALLLRFADSLQARHRERNPQKPGRKPGQPIVANIPPIRSFIAGDIIFGIGIAVLLVGFAIWGVSRVVAIQSEQEVQPTAPSISDVLLASPDPSQLGATPTLQPVESFPGAATLTIVVPTQDANVEVQLNLVASERTYMRVVVDGEVTFDGRVVPGNAYPFQAESQIEVLVGSGAAIRTVYNGRDLGLMGTFGQVVSSIYTTNGVITPTALPSPSATSTVPSTGTVSPTATPSSTGTIAPSSTPTP